MARRERGLTWGERAHVVGRTALALCIGWGYLALVLAVDAGGWGTWMQASPFGLMVRAQIVALFGVTFGAVGAHIGYCNVMASEVAFQRAQVAQRRTAMRRWQRY